MRNRRHRESTSIVYKRSGLFIALQVDLQALQLMIHQQSHAFSLPPWGRFLVQIWFAEEIIQNNLIYRNKNCCQIKGYFYNKVTKSKLWLLVPLVSHTRSRNLSKTHMQHLYRRPQACHRGQTTSTSDVPILHQQPLLIIKYPELEHYFCLGNNTKTQKPKVVLAHFFWTKQAQVTEVSLEKPQRFYLSHLMQIMN